MNKLNVFIPHRWIYDDYEELSALLDRTKFNVRDYSVPQNDPFDKIDRRYSVDPQIQRQIQHASVVVCSNRPANNNGMAVNEIEYALSINKPVVAVMLTDYSGEHIQRLGIPLIPKRKNSLETWIVLNRR